MYSPWPPPILLPVSNIPFLHPTYHSKSNRKISQAKHPRLNTYKNLIFRMDCFYIKNINHYNQSIERNQMDIIDWKLQQLKMLFPFLAKSCKVAEDRVETTVPIVCKNVKLFL